MTTSTGHREATQLAYRCKQTKPEGFGPCYFDRQRSDSSRSPWGGRDVRNRGGPVRWCGTSRSATRASSADALGVVRNLPAGAAGATFHPPVAPGPPRPNLQDGPEESRIARVNGARTGPRG